MVDPIDAILWSLLNRETVVDLEEVCWWDCARAERTVLAAGMRHLEGRNYQTTDDTAHWFEETWNAIRATSPAKTVDRRRKTAAETDENPAPAQIPVARAQAHLEGPNAIRRLRIVGE